MTTNQSAVSQPDDAVATPFSSLTPVHWGTLGLGAITGVIHLYLYTTESWLPFLLAGAGFFGAIGLFFAMKNYRRYLYLGGIPYTLAQIGGYLLFPMGPVWLAAIDKVVQVAFIIALAYLFATERRERLGRDRVDVDRDVGAGVDGDVGAGVDGDVGVGLGVPADDRSREG